TGSKTAVVTGGTSGIGRAVAESLAASGIRVVVASRDADRCEKTAQDLRARGGEALGMPTDVADPAAIRALVEAASDFGSGAVDILVAAAGTLVKGIVDEITPETLDHAFSVNVFGAMHGVREVV